MRREGGMHNLAMRTQQRPLTSKRPVGSLGGGATGSSFGAGALLSGLGGGHHQTAHAANEDLVPV